jgi:DNA-binding ferritin-like protein (Dps family)
MSLLSNAEPISTRLKMYVYGPTGVGKTVTALHFPSPAVIDAERGTEHYGKFFKFKRIFTANPDTIIAVIDELLQNPVVDGETIKTLVVDPISVVYDTLVSNYESKMKVKTGNASYQLKPLDYKYIKSEVRRLGLKLLSLDMNVIVTAKEKIQYSSDPSEFMKVEGTSPEGPKDFPYLFDVVLRLSKTTDGKFWANVEKDRTNNLPPEFEYSYETFTKYLGIEGLEREPVVFNQQRNLIQRNNRTVKTIFNGKEIMTAGITGDNLEKIQNLVKDYGADKLTAKLKEDYLVDSALDLKNDEAELFISDINQELAGNAAKE